MVPEYLYSLAASVALTLAILVYLKRKGRSVARRPFMRLVAVEFILGVVWDLFAVWRGWWAFPNAQYLTGFYILWLPIEEYLFILVVTVGVAVMYELLQSLEL
jgi:lycopene cyclase domain-containing protein